MRAHNDPEYRAAKRWLKAHPDTPCWKRCGRTATTIDHHPRLMDHTHTRGARCCTLHPACARCNYSDGASAGNRRRNPTSEDW